MTQKRVEKWKEEAEKGIRGIMKTFHEEFKFSEEDLAFSLELKMGNKLITVFFSKKIHNLVKKGLTSFPLDCGLTLCDDSKTVYLSLLHDDMAIRGLIFTLNRIVEQLKTKKSKKIVNSKMQALKDLLKIALKARVVDLFYKKGDYRLIIITESLRISRDAKSIQDLVDYGAEAIGCIFSKGR